MVPTATASRRFHLIDAEPDGGVEGRVLRVPDGVSRLIVDGDDMPRLLPDGATGAAGGVVLEPIIRNRELLLLLVPLGGAVRVNGAAAGRLATARETDTVQVGETGHGLHVAVHVHAVKGPAPRERATEPCVLCKRPLGGCVVYICSICGNAVHCDTGVGDRLNCMLSDNCPSCQTPVRTDGYAWLPEDLTA